MRSVSSPVRCTRRPLRLVPEEWRDRVVKDLALGNEHHHRVRIDGDLDPACRFIFQRLLGRYNGDWGKVVSNHIRVKRLLLSEKDRVGIGTFQPKDEKNQDSTELTGDINYRKIAEYGSDSDPRAFNFDGEFNIANRGIVEFVEILKLDVAFLYDLLARRRSTRSSRRSSRRPTSTRSSSATPTRPSTSKLLNNEFMEALRDRTIKIDIPYITKMSRRGPHLREGLQRLSACAANTSPRTRSRWRRCGPCSPGSRSPRSTSFRCCRR